MTHSSRLMLLLGLCILTTACTDPDPVSSEDPMSRDMAMAKDLGTLEDAGTVLDAASDLNEDLGGEADASPVDMMTQVDADMPDLADLSDMQPDMDRPPLDFAPLEAALAQDIQSNNASAASVAIWHEGRIVWVGGFGQTEEGRVPDEETMFMIGSDTKKIASLVYLKQVERGMATPQTTIASQLPTFSMPYAPNFPGATAHDLMSNRGGLSDHTGQYSSTTTDPELRSYVEETLPQVAYEMAPPGLFFNYSNPSFSMLGLMTETVTGQFWADVAHDDLFVPLDMTRTVARKAEVDDNRATGVGIASFMDMTVEPVSYVETWENAFVRPAGLVWSTPTDQMKLARFLVEGDAQILSDALRAQISTPQTPLYPDLPGSYGYGLNVSRGLRLGTTYHDVPVWSHGGNTLTHTSTFYVLPEQKFAISILSNGLGDDFTRSIVTAVSTLVDLPAPVIPPDVTFDPQGIDALTGSYTDPYNLGRVTLTRVGDAMRIDMPDVEAANVPYEPMLTPISTRVWQANFQNTDFLLEFYDGPGRTMYMANRAFVATRSPLVVVGLAQPFTFSHARFAEAVQHQRLDRLDLLIRPW